MINKGVFKAVDDGRCVSFDFASHYDDYRTVKIWRIEQPWAWAEWLLPHRVFFSTHSLTYLWLFPSLHSLYIYIYNWVPRFFCGLVVPLALVNLAITSCGCLFISIYFMGFNDKFILLFCTYNLFSL